LISEYQYGTFANYSPRGRGKQSIRSRQICGHVKKGSLPLLESMISNFVKPECAPLLDLFDNRMLVPIPKSSPKQANVLWPSLIICNQLLHNGYGVEVVEGVQRTTPIQKSAFASAKNRPTVAQQMETLKCTLNLISNPNITLIDDVLTQGTTSVACAEIIKSVLPHSDIRIFSVIRTQGLVPDIETLVDPSTGTIKYFKSGKVFREP